MWSRWKRNSPVVRQNADAEAWCGPTGHTVVLHDWWTAEARPQHFIHMTLSCHQFRFDKKVVLNWCTWNENSGSSSRNLVFLTDHSVSSFLAKSKFLKDKLTEWLVLSAGQTSVRDMVDVPSGFCWFSVWVLFPVVFFGWEFVFLLHVRVLSQNQRKPPTVCKRCT